MVPSGVSTTTAWVVHGYHSTGLSRSALGRMLRPGLSSSQVRSQLMDPQSRTWSLVAVPAMATSPSLVGVRPSTVVYPLPPGCSPEPVFRAVQPTRGWLGTVGSPGTSGGRVADHLPRIAVVTGAGSGIGAGVAHALAGDGWVVVLAGRRREALASVAQGGAELPGVLDPAPTDVTDEASVRALFDRTVERYRRLDLLFNNAGTFSPARELDAIPLAEWNAAVAVNLTGAFLCTREAFRVMRHQRPRGGRIINNGSISAHAPRPRSAAYTATKHAITGLTRSTALDGRAYDIACGQIDIGNAATDLTEAMASGALQADGSVRPEPRMDVADVARAVRYMANLPLDANVATMTVMATKMPFIGRG